MRTGYWSLFVPSQAVGASKVFFDLWNGSERAITVSSLKAIKDGSVAITGTLAVKLHLTRTSAEGSGGTAATADGTSLTAATISKLQRYALPDGITARLTPSGGATAGAVICERQVFAEETTGVNYEPVEFLPSGLIVPEGTGIRVVQGAIAATGNIGFNAVFF
jgi:hypothetical protein